VTATCFGTSISAPSLRTTRTSGRWSMHGGVCGGRLVLACPTNRSRCHHWLWADFSLVVLGVLVSMRSRSMNVSRWVNTGSARAPIARTWLSMRKGLSTTMRGRGVLSRRGDPPALSPVSPAVPHPPNESRTTSPSLLHVLMMRSRSATGFLAGIA
jgi:hypothetical protein